MSPTDPISSTFLVEILFHNAEQFGRPFAEIARIGIHDGPHGSMIEGVDQFSVEVFDEVELAAAVRPALPRDTEAVSAILTEAARWLAARGDAMWKDGELTPERIADDVRAGLFFVAERRGEVAGTIKFQLSDQIFWPDVPDGDSAFIHRLAVRRSAAGSGVSTVLLYWAKARAIDLGRTYLRLDCEASRVKLRRFYEKAGFTHHSDRQVGPYFVARYELALGPTAHGLP